MGRRLGSAWLLLGLLLAWPGAAWSQASPGLAEQPQEAWATVLKVYDGDTLLVLLAGRREKLRLLGVDAPETSHSRKLERSAQQKGRTPQKEAAMGELARTWLAGQLPRGAGLRLVWDPQAPRRDQHGRLLAYAHLPDGRQINEMLLAQGWARAFRRCGCLRGRSFQELERQARAQRQGLWSQGGP